MLFNRQGMKFLEETAGKMLTTLTKLSVNQIASFNALNDFLIPQHSKRTNRMKLAIIMLCLVKAIEAEKATVIPCLHRGIYSLATDHIPLPSLKRGLKEFAEDFGMARKDFEKITLPEADLCKQPQSRGGSRSFPRP